MQNEPHEIEHYSENRFKIHAIIETTKNSTDIDAKYVAQHLILKENQSICFEKSRLKLNG